MGTLTLDLEAGRLSAELARRGIDPDQRVHALVMVPGDDNLPMGALAQAGADFAFLDDEPDIHRDADTVECRGQNA